MSPSGPIRDDQPPPQPRDHRPRARAARRRGRRGRHQADAARPRPRGGVELVYEARPTPKVPEVTPQAVEDAISTIRRRTDALGVAEPEIQRSGTNQITVALPDVENAERAIDQVGTTAQLQFYDWEPNLIVSDGEKGTVRLLEAIQAQSSEAQERPQPSLFEAVQLATKAKPLAEETDLPPGGASPAVERRLGRRPRPHPRGLRPAQRHRRREVLPVRTRRRPDPHADRRPGYELPRAPERVHRPRTRRRPRPADATAGERRRAELGALGAAGPPEGSTVVRVPRGIAVVQAERPENVPETTEVNQYWVLEDDSSSRAERSATPNRTSTPRPTSRW